MSWTDFKMFYMYFSHEKLHKLDYAYLTLFFYKKKLK